MHEERDSWWVQMVAGTQYGCGCRPGRISRFFGAGGFQEATGCMCGWLTLGWRWRQSLGRDVEWTRGLVSRSLGRWSLRCDRACVSDSRWDARLGWRWLRANVECTSRPVRRSFGGKQLLGCDREMCGCWWWDVGIWWQVLRCDVKWTRGPVGHSLGTYCRWDVTRHMWNATLGCRWRWSLGLRMERMGCRRFFGCR